MGGGADRWDRVVLLQERKGEAMSLTALLALVCIVLGLIGPIIDEKILMGALEWFVLAIAFNTLTIDYSFGRKP
jgi:hypothetical protein